MQFRALPSAARIDLHPRQLVGLLKSINTNRIAMGAGPMRRARAWILNFYTNTGDYAMFVYLGSEEGDGQGLLFQSVPEVVPLGDYDAYQALAAQLVDSQGFDMERVEVSALGRDSLVELADELPFAPKHQFGGGVAHATPTAPNPAIGAPPLSPAEVNTFAESPNSYRGSFRRAGALTPSPQSGSRGTASDPEAVEVLSRLLALF